MLRHGILAAMILGTALFTANAQQSKVKSGPQTGEEVPGPFHPLNVTGADAGKKACLYCSNGGNPVAVVFAREATPAVAKLLKQLDAATVKNAKAEMGSFAVFCSDKDGLDKALAKMAREQKLSKLVLSIDNPAGPKSYKIAREADVTVILYKDFSVKANHSFRRGELNDLGIKRVVADVAKILK